MISSLIKLGLCRDGFPRKIIPMIIHFLINRIALNSLLMKKFIWFPCNEDGEQGIDKENNDHVQKSIKYIKIFCELDNTDKANI